MLGLDDVIMFEDNREETKKHTRKANKQVQSIEMQWVIQITNK